MTELEVLKLSVEKGTVNMRDPLIWIMADTSSRIIADQYIDKISRDTNLEVTYLYDLSQATPDPLGLLSVITVVVVDEANEMPDLSNCIVLCKKSKHRNAIKFPKLTNWQISDYIKSNITKGLPGSLIENFVQSYNGNYDRCLLDAAKIGIFDSSMQQMVHKQMVDQGCFVENTGLSIFDLSNAILEKDFIKAEQVLKIVNYIDVTPMALYVLLYNNFRRIADIQLNPKCTAASLGISDKQFYAIKRSAGHYGERQLREALKLLTEIENKFKYEGLEQSEMIDYMICKLIGG